LATAPEGDDPRAGRGHGHLPPESESEAELVRRARAGERAAFDRIIRLHSERVFRIVAALVGPEDAEDASQEAFLNVFAHFGAFRGDSELATWIYRIATNVALRRLERRKRLAPSRLVGGVLSEASTGPLPVASSTEEREILRAALDRLPEEQRAVVVLRGIEELPFEDVARILAIPKPTAQSRMARAKERLRVLLAPLLEPRQ
jgi:RNA polymerase sigma-70 factor (ECF subfamily)